MKVLLCFLSLSDLSHPGLLHVLLMACKLHDASVFGLHLLLLHASPLGLLPLEFFDVLLSCSDLLQFQLSLPSRKQHFVSINPSYYHSPNDFSGRKRVLVTLCVKHIP